MRALTLRLVLPLCLGLGAPAHAVGACPDAAALGVLFSSCGGDARATALLLPEDLSALAPAQPGLVVTGAYTGAEKREGGMPKPVGLFIRAGEIVSREFAPMDGVLLIDAEGRPELYHREAVAFGPRVWRLDDREERAAFIAAAEAAGASVAQSHLIVVDGAADVAGRENAPRFRRRAFVTHPDGWWGIWDSGARRLTLREAALEIERALGADMALNLDMGSYDYCVAVSAEGAAEICGALGAGQTARLSNLLAVSRSR